MRKSLALISVCRKNLKKMPHPNKGVALQFAHAVYLILVMAQLNPCYQCLHFTLIKVSHSHSIHFEIFSKDTVVQEEIMFNRLLRGLS